MGRLGVNTQEFHRRAFFQHAQGPGSNPQDHKNVFFKKKKEEEEKERKKKLSAKNSNKPSPCLLQVCSARRGGRDGCLAPAKEGQRAHG